MKPNRYACHALALFLATVAASPQDEVVASQQSASGVLQPGPGQPSALHDAVILIIRHAEKPASGPGLSAAGQQRAQAYVHYFKDFVIESAPLNLDYLAATADSAGSQRPRLTLEPLSQSLGLEIDSRFKSKQCRDLASDLQSHSRGKRILIAWHHGQIPALLEALGGDPAKLLPGATWPDDEFSWVLELRYDHDGRLIPGQARRINEALMPGDPK